MSKVFDRTWHAVLLHKLKSYGMSYGISGQVFGLISSFLGNRQLRVGLNGKQLELASELESDLRDTVDWCRQWFVDFNAGKTQWVCS